VILADRGFGRARFIAWLERHRLDYVVRVKKGTCVTEASGHRWKLGEEGLGLGELRFAEGVRYGLYHDRPRELLTNVVLCWRIPKSRAKDPSARATRRALVPGHEPQGRQQCRLVVLAERVDRAVLQGRQEPLRVGAGAGRLSGAPFALADGAERRPLVADADGVA
jgi:Transposase DDE domain